MQFKSLFVVISAVAAVFAASSVTDVANGVADIDSKVADLEKLLQAFPQTGGTFEQAKAIHNTVDDVLKAIDATKTTADDVNDIVSVADGQKIMDAFHNMEPVIKNALQTLDEKKDSLSSIGVGRVQAIIQLDLQHLLDAVVGLAGSLLAKSPADCKPEAQGISLDIQAAIKASIKLFA
ncbi:hypothetical protein NP233_g6260 [Leucocoprinus birnbaumii]|uniref:Uncharacterized protein n=1 Tax=Leucocoprinus birnbaumii TaxID=56174 RepID=A0AAD5VSI7_9AGAR|nr:hypothetical protein NP233_g6260 [Leucocoprinus birnbaumii]